MNMDERIRRINELYHKSQAEGLSDEEKAEQARLRSEYVASVRGNLRAQLDRISIERPDGTVENLGERHKSRKEGGTGSLQEQKKMLREQVLRAREALSEEDRTRAAVLLTERILGHQWFYLSDSVLGFAGYGSEIDTDEILTEALRKGKKLYLPRVEGENMEFYRVYELAGLRPGYKGIREPEGDTEAYRYTAEDAAHVLMLMPGVAFDPFRNRMGYGKGFYDRFLADKPELQLRTIGVGYACQMAEEVPHGEGDIKPYQVICV